MFVIQHQRRPTLAPFGPFVTKDEAAQWLRDVRSVPLHLTRICPGLHDPEWQVVRLRPPFEVAKVA